jgi:hypothetical protein
MTVKLDRRRLVKVLGMLGSRHDGEVLAAARLAQHMLGQSKTSWGELLGVKPGEEPEPLPQEDEASGKAKGRFGDPDYPEMLKAVLKSRAIDPKSRKKMEAMSEKLERGGALGLDDKLLVRWLYHTLGPKAARG